MLIYKTNLDKHYLLMYACILGKFELVKFLANTNLDIKTIKGVDAHQLAIMNDRNSRNNNNLFRRLIRN